MECVLYVNKIFYYIYDINIFGVFFINIDNVYVIFLLNKLWVGY